MPHEAQVNAATQRARDAIQPAREYELAQRPMDMLGL